MKSTSPVTRAVAAGAMAYALAGCAILIPGSNATPGVEPDPDRSVSTDISGEDVTLRVAFTDGPEMVEALAEAFEREHPNVTVKPEHTEFTDYEANLKLMMTSDSPPDIAQQNVQTKDLIDTGHILDLDPYSEAYDWPSVFPENALDPLTLTEDGKKQGTGYLYGVPAGMSMSGIFYNKKLADDIGVDIPPSDLDDFEDVMDRAKDAGVTPLQVGALDSGGLHLWTELLNSMISPQQYRDFVSGADGGSITGDDTMAATEKLADWGRSGYINDSANGLGQADSTAEFAAGKSLFLINGNWAAEAVDSALGEDAGFFPLPGATADQPAAASGSSVGYQVSSLTPHPDVAAAFLDFMGSTEAAEIVSAGGFEPPNAEVAPEPDGVRADIHDGYTDVVEADGLQTFPDSAAPAAYNTIVPGIQGLLSGEVTPAQHLREVQQVRDDYQAE